MPRPSRATVLYFTRFAALGLLAALAFHVVQHSLIRGDKTVTLLESPVRANPPPQATPVTSYHQAVRRAAPAVVNIFTRSRYRLDNDGLSPLLGEIFGEKDGESHAEHVETNAGSGVIVSPEGYILTNHHVIDGATEIQAILPDIGSFPAALIGTDPETDLAVLQVETNNPLPAMTLSHNAPIRVGDVVLAIGNPFGVGQTVTQGIVSAVGRNRLGLNTFEEFIQTDAAINPGNSGGALVNAHGEMIGINTAVFTNSEGAQGISFAIPVSVALNIMIQLIERGDVSRGWLGVQAYDITETMRSRFSFTGPGVLVTGVFHDSPAEMAGIAAGDIITHIEGQGLLDTQMLLNATKNRPPSTRVRIEGLRNGRKYSIMATLMRQPVPGVQP